jgi:predicted permease
MVGVDERGGFLQAGGLLLTVVGLVLLIACANVANLLLGRSASRRREIALRLALGAPRLRIVRQLLVESLALALLAGLSGLAIAFWARRALWAMRPPFLADSPIDLSFDPRVLGFTLIVTLLTGLLFGLLPALQGSRQGLVTDLVQASDSATGMTRVLSFRNLLVAGQIALSLVALVGSGLFLRSLGEATRTDVGFAPGKLAVMSFNLGLAGYDDARGEILFDRMVEHVRTLPGIEGASLTTIMPFTGRDHFQRTVIVEGRSPADDDNAKLVPVTTTDADLFSVLGVRLLRGRELSTLDRADAAPVAVINEAMAELFWSGGEAIGQRFHFLGQDVVREVVGIVHTTKFQAIGESPQPLVYIPRWQSYVPAMSLVARAAADPETILGTLQSELRSLEPSLAITDVQTGGAAVEQALWPPRMAATLLAVLGLLALLLAAVGIYGVTSYTVSQRRREISIRMAMGAGRGAVLRLVLTQGLEVAAIGLLLGAAVAFVAGRSIAALLYGVSPADPATFLLTAAVLALVALGANLLPAVRATAVDPAATLRFER